MSIESPLQLDNTPNLDKELPFSIYRERLDSISGMMRIGLCSLEEYSGASNSRTTYGLIEGIGRIPLAMSNANLGSFDMNIISGDAQIALLPKKALGGQILLNGLLIPSQINLPDDVVDRVLAGDTDIYTLMQSFHENESTNLVSGTGVPEYMFFSSYAIDTASTSHLDPISELETSTGHIVTTKREWMLQHLDKLQKLHTDIFDSQTVQTGYYGGLSIEDVEKFIRDENFVPIVAYDPVTEEPLMLTLFAPNFTDFESIPWLNPRAINQQMMQSTNQSDTLSLPLVITSKVEGLGLFEIAAELAARHTLSRTGANVFNVMYESNGVSIGFTPRIIHKTLKRLGFDHQKTTAESTFYEVGSFDTIRS